MNTVLRKWQLSVIRHHKELKRYEPRFIMTNKVLKTALGGIEHHDLINEPRESGGQRTGRLGFTVQDVVPRQGFGISGTQFKLTVEDVRGNTIKAEYSFP